MAGKRGAAVLVDADDIPHDALRAIYSALSSGCDVRVFRVFGNFARPSRAVWTDLSAEFPLEYIMTPENTPGKSPASLALALDAMDLIFTSDIDVFCLCSAGSDFSRLARKLRGYGKQVIGIGGRCSCHAFRTSCTRFLNLSDIGKCQGDALSSPAANSGASDCTGPAAVPAGCDEALPGGEYPGDAAPETAGDPQPEAAAEALKGEENSSNAAQDVSGPAPLTAEDVNSGILSRSELEGIIQKAVRALSLRKQGKVSLSDLAQLLKKEIPGFSASSFGCSKLKKLIVSFSSLKVFGDSSNLLVAIADGHVPEQNGAPSELERLIRRVYLQLCIRHKNGDISTSDLCNAIVIEKPGFSSRKYGFSKFRNLLKSLGFVKVTPRKGKPPLVKIEGN